MLLVWYSVYCFPDYNVYIYWMCMVFRAPLIMEKYIMLLQLFCGGYFVLFWDALYTDDQKEKIIQGYFFVIYACPCLSPSVVFAVPAVPPTDGGSLPSYADVLSPLRLPDAFAGSWSEVVQNYVIIVGPIPIWHILCEADVLFMYGFRMRSSHLSVGALVVMYEVDHTSSEHQAAKQGQSCSRYHRSYS